VHTVFDLGGKWAVPGNGYAATIQKLADGVMQTAAGLRSIARSGGAFAAAFTVPRS
jgi:hypothetical protein